MRINGTDSDDLFQQVLLKVWKALPKFDYNQKQGSFRSWLYRVTQNTVLNYIAKGAFRQHEFLSLSDHYAEPEVEKIIKDEWEKHVAALAFNNVKDSMSELSMNVFLASLEGIGTESIAQKYGLSESSVYVYKMRVKNALAAEIRHLRGLLE
jgi:RNA polymerase sigma factor (sigma-70 family)